MFLMLISLSSSAFSLPSELCRSVVTMLRSSKLSVGRYSRDCDGLDGHSCPSASSSCSLKTTHFCVVFLALSTTSDPNLIISPVKTSVNPLSWPALLSLTLFTKVPFELPVSRMTNLLSSKRRSAWALESTLQSKNPFVDSDLSFLKARPILQGTSRSIARSENLKVPGLAFRIAFAVILCLKVFFLRFKVFGLGSLWWDLGYLSDL